VSPIFTYNKGTNQPGVSSKEHALIFSDYHHYYQPQLLLDEVPLSKEPICMVMAEGQEALPVTSSICFGTLKSVQYNIKVKDIGYVHATSLSEFSGYWDMEHARVPDMIPHYKFCSLSTNK
jgi:hypothetical protein